MHEGHREKLKRRFLAEGFDNFESHQILELALFYVIPRKDTNETAHELIQQFGSFSGVFDAPIEELCKVKGITENGAVFLKMILGVAREYEKDKSKEINIINSTEAAKKMLAPLFMGLTKEKFLALCLRPDGKVVKCDEISSGTVSGSELNKRKIVEMVISTNASAVILAHNHPGGISKPSAQDILATKSIISTLKNLDVDVLDHIIFSDKNDITVLSETSEYGHLF